MTSILKTTIVSSFRIGPVVVGGGITALTILHLASMPPPPPGSDGFAHGMAAIFGGGVVLISLGLAAVTVVLPTLLGREDPLGFDCRQRLALKGSGGFILLGVLIAFVTGLSGVVHLLALIVLAFGIVCTTLVWRGVEVLNDDGPMSRARPNRRTRKPAYHPVPRVVVGASELYPCSLCRTPLPAVPR